MLKLVASLEKKPTEWLQTKLLGDKLEFGLLSSNCHAITATLCAVTMG